MLFRDALVHAVAARAGRGGKSVAIYGYEIILLVCCG